MPFTLITITMNSERPDAGASSGTVTAQLSEPIQNGTVSVDATPITGSFSAGGALVNSAGQAFQLEANDDAGTIPPGSWYEFTIERDSAPIETFKAVVSHTVGGGTVDVATLRQSPVIQ